MILQLENEIKEEFVKKKWNLQDFKRSNLIKGGKMSERNYKKIIILFLFLITILTTYFIVKQYTLFNNLHDKSFSQSFDRTLNKGEQGEPPFKPGGMQAHIIKIIAEELTLSNEQEQIFKNIIEEIIEFRKKQRKDKPRNEDNIIALIKKQKITINDVMEIHHARMSEMRVTDEFVAEKLVIIHSILTTEQKEILIEKIQSFQKRVRK